MLSDPFLSLYSSHKESNNDGYFPRTTYVRRSLTNPLHSPPIAPVTIISLSTSLPSLGAGPSESNVTSSCECSSRIGITFSTTSPMPKTSEYDASPIFWKVALQLLPDFPSP